MKKNKLLLPFISTLFILITGIISSMSSNLVHAQDDVEIFIPPDPAPTPAYHSFYNINVKWITFDSAEISCTVDTDGWYCYEWVIRNRPRPAFDDSQYIIPIKSSHNINIIVNNLDTYNPIDVYIRVKGVDNIMTKYLHIPLNESTRPKKPASLPIEPLQPVRKPVTPSVTKSIVKGLEKPLKFYPNTFYPFTVIGAGADTKLPYVSGDVKWEPLYWSTSSSPADFQKNLSWKIGAKNAIKDAATYNMYIFFRKYIYAENAWQATDIIESEIVPFASAKLIPTSTPAVESQANSKISAKKFIVSKISQKSYNKKPQTPAITVKYKGKKLTKNRDYTISYKNNKTPGKAQCIIKGKGKYSGSKTVYFNISPSKQKITNIKSTKRKTVTLKFNKLTGQSGVQICYSTNSKFNKPNYVSTTSTSKTISNLSRKKNYYFKVRAYKTVSGQKIYGPYSAVKKISIK